MNNEERLIQERLSGIGLPDDLVETALADEPGPSAEAVARMKARALQMAAGGPAHALSPAPVPRSRWYRWPAVAAAALLLALAAAGPDRVTAAMQSIRAYIPGFGVQRAESFLLYAPDTVRVAYRGGTIEVPGLMATPDRVTLRLLLRGMDQWGPGRTRLETESGRALNGLRSAGVGGASYQEQWLTFAGPVDSRTRSLVLVIEDGENALRIPIPLVPAAGENPLESFGPSATATGLRVAARAETGSDRTAITLLMISETQLVDGLPRPASDAIQGTLSAPGWESSLTQESAGLGQMRTATAGPLPAGVGQVRLTLRSILVAEEGEGQIEIPNRSGPIDRTVRLGRWEVKVTRAERDGNRLKLFLDLGPDGPASLHGIAEIGLVKGPSVVGIATSAESGRLEWFELSDLPESESVTVRFRYPEVRLQGPWVFDLGVQR